MARLPTPGGDDGTWGGVLNDYLQVEHNADGTLKSGGSLSSKADDSSVVHKTGAETIAGVKTFSSAPVVPSASFPESAVANLTTDLAGKADDTAVVHDSGNESIDGVKTFTSSPVVPDSSFTQAKVTNLVSDLAAKAADSAVVHDTGDETIAGVKTFSSGVIAPSVKVTGEAGMSNITPLRMLGVLNHAGAPVGADGTFAVGDALFDLAGQHWLCTVAGSPGTWIPVGSGRVLGSQVLASGFTMTTANTPEDVPTWSCSFTYDGRPVNIKTTPCLTSQDQNAVRLISITLRRSSDSAIQATSLRQTTAVAGEVQNQFIETGPITAWPSDSTALVVGTTYTVKMNLTSGASSRASISGASQSAMLYVVTA